MSKPQGGPPLQILIVGAGAFGASAALELRRRGHGVTVIDPGPLPHPDASSTDISKMVRMDYGEDDLYIDLGMRALDRWDEWNRSLTPGLFHPTGFLILASEGWEAGGFEYDSYQALAERGQPVQTVNGERMRREFPAWSHDVEWRGYTNERAGWAESGRVVEALIRAGEEAGVRFEPGEAHAELMSVGSTVRGVRTVSGREIAADHVVMATGAWTPVLLPELGDRMWAVGQPVFHFEVDPAPFQPPVFRPWAADISTSGWYGFPAKDDGTLKMANHGPGIRVDPREERNVPADAEDRFRAFLESKLPSVVDAPVRATRLCLYSETFDNDFLIDRVPGRDGVTVAAGGSGHGFKFAPVLGPIIADAVEDRREGVPDRFRWRELASRRVEPARWMGPS